MGLRLLLGATDFYLLLLRILQLGGPLVDSFPRSWNQSRSKITLFQGGAWVLGLKTMIGGPSSGRSSPAYTSPARPRNILMVVSRSIPIRSPTSSMWNLSI